MATIESGKKWHLLDLDAGDLRALDLALSGKMDSPEWFGSDSIYQRAQKLHELILQARKDG